MYRSLLGWVVAVLILAAPLSASSQARDGRALARDVRDFVEVCLDGQADIETWSQKLRQKKFELTESRDNSRSFFRSGTDVLLRRFKDGMMCLFNVRTNELADISGIMRRHLSQRSNLSISEGSAREGGISWKIQQQAAEREVLFKPIELVKGPSVAFLVAF